MKQIAFNSMCSQRDELSIKSPSTRVDTKKCTRY